jgi:hypothetical protein
VCGVGIALGADEGLRHAGKHAAHGCCKCRSAYMLHNPLIWYSRSLLETSMVCPSNVANKARLTSHAPNRMIGW